MTWESPSQKSRYFIRVIMDKTLVLSLKILEIIFILIPTSEREPIPLPVFSTGIEDTVRISLTTYQLDDRRGGHYEIGSSWFP